MNYNFTLFTAICMVMLMLTPGTSVGEPPSIPESFDGTVTVNGKLAQDGTVVSVFIDDKEVVKATTVNGEYDLEVPGSAGDTITFKVYNVVATTAAWNLGGFTELDLSVEGVVVPKSTGVSVNSAAPSTTSAPTPTVTMTEGDISTEPPTGASAESQEAASTMDRGEKPTSSIPGSTPTPTVIITEEDISTEPPTGASAESQEAASTMDHGEKPTSSIPGFAGVTAVFMLLMLFWRRRNSERK